MRKAEYSPIFMTDCFALLSFLRRPWLDEEELKNRFHSMAAEQHPDAGTGGDAETFAALNAAYTTLRDPARRLRHLLDLEHSDAFPSAPPIAPDLANWFMDIAAQRRAIRLLRQQKTSSDSRLAGALLVDDKAKIERNLRAAQDRLEIEYARALDELREMDAAWPGRDAEMLARAALLQARLTYLGRWLTDVREGLLEMMMAG